MNSQEMGSGARTKSQASDLGLKYISSQGLYQDVHQLAKAMTPHETVPLLVEKHHVASHKVVSHATFGIKQKYV